MIVEASSGTRASRSRTAWPSRRRTLTCGRPDFLGLRRVGVRSSTRRSAAPPRPARSGFFERQRWLAVASAAWPGLASSVADIARPRSAAANQAAVASDRRGACRANFRSRYAADGGQASHRLVVQVALDVAAPGRWPSRSGGCGPSPAPSSRSSRGRRAPASPASAGSMLPAGRDRSAASSDVLSRVLGLRRLLLADHAAASRRTPPRCSCLRVQRRRAGQQLVEQHAQRSRCRCACRCRARSARPARGSCTRACRSLRRTR